MSKTVAFHTLGCKLNFSETSSISRSMEAEGFVRKDFDELADIYVINTCSVTDNADKECRQLVRRIKRRAEDSMVVIIGCYAQLKPKEISEIEGVDMVLGAAEKFNLAHHVKAFHKGDETKICSCDIDEVSGFNASYSIGDRTRTFLKVQDGCDYNCSFCTIPLARGHSRSDTINNVVANVKELAKQGTKEIVLTGINLGDFGKGDEGGKKVQETFFELIKTLDALDDIERYRISSIEPNLLTHEIIDFVAQSRHFMPHFHIPLQSGDNEILGNMRRRYKKELYEDRVTYIKEKMPHCCIGVDVIVGFPGETDENFENTRTFLRDLDVSYFHVFTYSERANTLASEMEQVPMEVRNRRNKQLRNLSYKKMVAFEEQHRGETRTVLFEHKNKNGILEGYSDNYIRVQAAFKPELENAIVDWMV
ncbi:MAG TPA: tRNA (N(6)-L-threonylcarbamoyladenosine(37)-C(2))-methylthiotransferase MtaB [Edaphocola sp.]|nr:tRNA (N(6)-L-threonylcarbamoyladenosine(37)-C(2))-methylthiotransferase MtaB [Edaphocola sp.]